LRQRPGAQEPLAAGRLSAANPVQADQGDWVGYGALRYLSDVHGFGGPTVASAQMHAIFMQQEGNECRISVCWGDPEGFLRDLAHSDFIHVADQYVNNTSNKPLHCRAGLPVDSANDLLSHETFETIADPDVDG